MSNVLMTIIFVLICALLIVAKVCDERTEENKRLIENLNLMSELETIEYARREQARSRGGK